MLRKAVFIGLTLSLAAAAWAAPKLRLSTTTVGPIFITQGQNGTTQSIDAANLGDGAFNFTATSTVTWTNVTFGVPHACTASSSCVPVNIGLTTSALARGTYTGVVTLTVTVQIGSGVPDSVDLYVAPNGSAATSFVTGSRLNTNVINPPGGPIVTIAAPSAGSFDKTFSYNITATAQAGTDADFQSTISITGSTTPGDNKSLPVHVHLTTQPIANVTLPTTAIGGTVNFRIATGGQPQSQNVVFTNPGQGTLTLSGVTGAPAWLTTKITSNVPVSTATGVTTGTILTLTADPTGLATGVQTATITVASNAKNNPTTIPVSLTVVAAGPPVVGFQQVVDDVNFVAGDPVAPGGWVAVFGEQLHTGAAVISTVSPIGTSLGGANVFVNNVAAPLYYVSETQINFAMPYGTPAGEAQVRVDRDGQKGNTVTVKVVPQAPRLLHFSVPGLDDYAEAYLNNTTTFAIPVTQGIASSPAQVGDVVVFFGFGLGQTTPPQSDGIPAASGTIGGSPKMILGQSSLPESGATLVPEYIGVTPGIVGVYQINVRIPPAIPRGKISAMLDMGNGVFSNRLHIQVQ
jgi:uncharacterized protein (TIGR03437 family)